MRNYETGPNGEYRLEYVAIVCCMRFSSVECEAWATEKAKPVAGRPGMRSCLHDIPRPEVCHWRHSPKRGVIVEESRDLDM